MANRSTKFTQSDVKRLFKAAMSAGVRVRVEFHPDGTIVASTGEASASCDRDTDLDKWMKKHADSA